MPFLGALKVRFGDHWLSEMTDNMAEVLGDLGVRQAMKNMPKSML